MEQAIAQGDIIWHGNALNNFLELEDAALFNFSLSMAKTLNLRFNKTYGSLAGKHADVAGMTKSAIPLLAAAGIRGFHIGYNGACKKPESLPPISRWKHPGTDTELILMAEGNYGTSIRSPQSSTMLVFMYQVDNTGPPSAEEVLDFWDAIRIQYPNSSPIASSLDSYVGDVLRDARSFNALPVITGEIGDSWLYGAPADPIKLATFREARRAMIEAVQAGLIREDAQEYRAYMRRLLKGPPEHNWGWAVTLPVPTIHTDPWDNRGFETTKTRVPGYAVLEKEWADQRDYCYPVGWDNQHGRPASSSTAIRSAAPDNAGNHSNTWQTFVMSELLPRLESVRYPAPSVPRSQRGETIPGGLPSDNVAGPKFSCGQLEIEFDATDGSIVWLKEVDTGVQWASQDKRLAQLRYQTFSTEDFDIFNLQYNAECGASCGDFAKAGMQGKSGTYTPKLVSLYRANTGPCDFLMELKFDDTLHINAGAPGTVEVKVSISADSKVVSVELTTRNKTATRLAEALWLSFVPGPSTSPSEWTMDVLGSPVSPMEVLSNGTRHMHAVWDGVTWSGGGSNLHIQSLDSPLVSPSDIHHLLRYDGDRQPSEFEGGMHFNLHNNVWGTAFPQWFGEDARFRFRLAFLSNVQSFVV